MSASTIESEKKMKQEKKGERKICKRK